MEKKSLLYFCLIVLGIFSLSSNFVCGLGVTPAKIEMNFESGFERTFEYSVSGIGTGKVQLSIGGSGLSKYVELDKNEIIGNSGSFKAHVNFPESVDTAGEQRIRIVIKEVTDDEELASAIGTSITLATVIDVYVPYPGKYIEIQKFNSNNGNVGEPINFEIGLVSRGKEIVEVFPKIEISSDKKKIETLYLKNRTLESGESIELTKTLETENYNPGEYNATLIVDYAGKKAERIIDFKIGNLDIEILNHTKQLFIGGIQKFQIEIQSGWNDPIDGAYADVFIFNSTNSRIIDFKTSSTNLIPWERKIIEGFFDTSDFQSGNYNANITLNYYGKSVGKSKSKVVQVELIEKQNNLIFIAIGIVLILILILLGVWFFIKKKKSKNKSEKETDKNEKEKSKKRKK